MSGKVDFLGQSLELSRTITDDEVDHFARVTGDDHPLHMDREFAIRSGLDGRIVQGAMLLGIMASASTAFYVRLGRPSLSYGYDKLRFTKVVNLGETVHVVYRVVEHDEATGKIFADVTVSDGSGAVVAVAKHIAKMI